MKLKAGIEIERPLALGVLKIKAKLGELLPAKPHSDRGQGRNGNKSSKPALPDFSKPVISAYRKLAAHKEKIEDYCEALEDVPTQAAMQFTNRAASSVMWWHGSTWAMRPMANWRAKRMATGSWLRALCIKRNGCEHVPILVRTKNLSFGHHERVASLPPAEQKKWLGKAEQEELSVADLRY